MTARRVLITIAVCEAALVVLDVYLLVTKKRISL